MITGIVRMLLTFGLLVIAWRNSHWSVALALTGLSVSNEINSALIKDLWKR